MCEDQILDSDTITIAINSCCTYSIAKRKMVFICKMTPCDRTNNTGMFRESKLTQKGIWNFVLEVNKVKTQIKLNALFNTTE